MTLDVFIHLEYITNCENVLVKSGRQKAWSTYFHVEYVYLSWKN